MNYCLKYVSYTATIKYLTLLLSNRNPFLIFYCVVWIYTFQENILQSNSKNFRLIAIFTTFI